VLWQPPFFNLVKCNFDGSTKGSPGPTTCGEIFRDKNANILGGFVVNVHITIAFQTELHGLINAIEIDFN
jgi:ribonuclease HI